MKVRADGSALLYSTFLAGFNPNGAAFDSDGSVVIAGGAVAPQPVSAQSFQSKPPGGCKRGPVGGSFVPPETTQNAFVLKLAADGTAPLWGTFVTGSCGDSANALQLDAAGDAIVTGYTYPTDFPVTANAMMPTFSGVTTSGFVAEISPDGARLLYSTYFGGGDNTSGNALALDGDGNVVVGGYTLAPASPGALAPRNLPACQLILPIGPHGDTNYEFDDGFVMKLALDGSNPAFFALIGGSCDTSVVNLWRDHAGHVWMAGTTASQNFPTLAPIKQFGAGNGAFLSEIDSSGSNLLFSTLTSGGARPQAMEIWARISRGLPARRRSREGRRCSRRTSMARQCRRSRSIPSNRPERNPSLSALTFPLQPSRPANYSC